MTAVEIGRKIKQLRIQKGLTLEELASVIAAPFWSTIARRSPAEAEQLTYLRKVYASLLITGPFSIVLGFTGGLGHFYAPMGGEPMIVKVEEGAY